MNHEDIQNPPSASVRITDIQPSGEAGTFAETTVQVPYAERFIYSNVAAFSVSLMDVRISFGEFLPNGTAVANLGVVMAPEQAAVLAMLLLAQVNAYEQNFGKIRDPRWRQFADTAAERAAKALQESKSA